MSLLPDSPVLRAELFRVIAQLQCELEIFEDFIEQLRKNAPELLRPLQEGGRLFLAYAFARTNSKELGEYFDAKILGTTTSRQRRAPGTRRCPASCPRPSRLRRPPGGRVAC